MKKLMAATGAVATVLTAAQAHATVIYSNVFTGTSATFLNGTTPAVTNNAGGEITATPTWIGGNLRHAGL